MTWRAIATVLAMAVVAEDGVSQVRPFEPEDGFLSERRVLVGRALSSCITELEVDHAGPVLDMGCTVVDSVRLGTEPRPRAWMVKYRRDAAFTYDSFTDTLAIDELVLVRATAFPDSVEVVWHLSRVQAHEFLQGVGSVNTPAGILVSYLNCVNGTGGCEQHFLLGGDTWSVVQQPYLLELERHVPAGWSLHKGRLIDLSSLSGIQPIATRDDANCCPSGALEFGVELRNGALELVRATVRRDT